MPKDLKILIIEDNPGDVLLIREAISAAGIAAQVKHCETAQAGIDQIRSYREHTEDIPDVILLDYNLPGGTACEMLGAARDNPALKQSKKAVLTCSVAPRDRDQSLAAGADMFVFKPSDLDGFLTSVGAAVRQLMDGKA